MLTYENFKKATEEMTRHSSLLKGSNSVNAFSISRIWIAGLESLDKKDIHDNFVDFICLIKKTSSDELIHWVLSQDDFFNRFPKPDQYFLKIASDNLFTQKDDSKSVSNSEISYFINHYLSDFEKIHNIKNRSENEKHAKSIENALTKYGVNFIHEAQTVKKIMIPEHLNLSYGYSQNYNNIYLDSDRGLELIKLIKYINVIPKELMRESFVNSIDCLSSKIKHSFFQNIAKNVIDLPPAISSVVIDVGIEQKFITQEEIKFFYTESVVKKLEKENNYFYSSSSKKNHMEFAENGICVSLDLMKNMMGDEYSKFTESSTFVLHLPWLTASKDFDPDFFLDPNEMKRIRSCSNLTNNEKKNLIDFIPFVKEEKEVHRLRKLLDKVIDAVNTVPVSDTQEDAFPKMKL